MIRLRLFGACSASAGAPGRDDVGRLLQAAAGREHHLAEAAELEVLGDVQRLRQAHQHALVLLEVVGATATGSVTSVGVDRAGAAVDDACRR